MAPIQHPSSLFCLLVVICVSFLIIETVSSFPEGTQLPTFTYVSNRTYVPNFVHFRSTRALDKKEILRSMVRHGPKITQSVESALRKIKVDPNTNLEQLLSKRLLKRLNLKRVSLCYTDEFGEQRLNIFRSSIKQIAHVFIKSRVSKIYRIEVLKLILNLIENLKQLVKTIVDCIESNPNDRSKYGLTALSALSKKEFDQTLNHKLAKNPNGNDSDEEDSSEDNSGKNEDEDSDEDNVVKQQSHISKHRYRKPATTTESSLCTQKVPLNRTRRSTKKFDKFTGTDNSLCNFRLKSKLPKKYDWRKYNAVTSIKHQGSCGSCYIFSAVASLESAYLRKKGAKKSKKLSKKLSLSEQDILDCAETNKCKGGYPFEAFKYMQEYGAVKNKYAPNKKKPGTCKSNKSAKRYKIKGYCQYYKVLTDKQLQTLVYKYGPAVVTIDAKPMKHLKGKFKSKCSTKTNHAVTLVGWDKKYWILKNSWSKNWGKSGYLYLKREKNKCGINKAVGVVVM